MLGRALIASFSFFMGMAGVELESNWQHFNIQSAAVG